jgi:hypothetical protein
MSTRFISTDGTWRVTVISLDDEQLLRVESTDIGNAGVDARGVIHTGIWYWVTDVRTPADVERLVPLAELKEVTA